MMISLPTRETLLYRATVLNFVFVVVRLRVMVEEVALLVAVGVVRLRVMVNEGVLLEVVWLRNMVEEVVLLVAVGAVLLRNTVEEVVLLVAVGAVLLRGVVEVVVLLSPHPLGFHRGHMLLIRATLRHSSKTLEGLSPTRIILRILDKGTLQRILPRHLILLPRTRLHYFDQGAYQGMIPARTIRTILPPQIVLQVLGLLLPHILLLPRDFILQIPDTGTSQ
ncbi:hypothetical protein QBC41DRAFT_105169 [Cercophora samala]|uniref:Uncharacterized protein n=1 Tax=Cercophora samala TaxID=330535 RepID=A0AA40DEN6_9PEZI|nr:hypothetical protein QBC41DRAFT_105169 [Cercophora samala]